MKKLLLIFTSLFFVTNSLRAATIFVDASQPDNSGNGLSWATAKKDLQVAINQALEGDQIWVKVGIYYPTEDDTGNLNPTDERQKTFLLKNGVKIYGSFLGTETNLAGRNVDLDVPLTILSGEIQQDGDATNNTRRVVTAVDLDNTTYLDFVIIQDGFASGGYTTGGGMYVYTALSTENNIVLLHTHFKNNYAANQGGAVLVEAKDGTIIDAKFEFCQFLKNKAGFDGGAVEVLALGSGLNKTTFNFCLFSENTANSAGAVQVLASGGGEASPNFIECEFIKNTSISDGGAFSNYVTNGYSNTSILRNLFIRNTAGGHGGGVFSMALQGENNLIVNQTYFESNKTGATYSGGGIMIFSDNTLGLNKTKINKCTFKMNEASYGGGVAFQGAQGEIKSYIYQSLFAKNIAENSSAIDSYTDNGLINSFIINSTITENTASSGSAVESIINGTGSSSNFIQNSIVYNNTNAGTNVDIVVGAGTGDQLLNSLVGNTDCSTWQAGYCLNNVFATDPLFVNAATGNYRLQACSPAINTGATGKETIGLDATDFANNLRIFETIDMGIFEYQLALAPPPIVTASTTHICIGTTTQFTADLPGGIWTSDNEAITTVDQTGVVTGHLGGTANIKYEIVGCNFPKSDTKPINVYSEAANITPTKSTYCVGNAVSFNADLPGGVWSSSNDIIAYKFYNSPNGFSMFTPGIVEIIYTIPCTVPIVTKKTITVFSPLDIGMQNTRICAISKTQFFANQPGGEWSSINTDIATIDANGLVSGVSKGLATIRYTMPQPLCDGQSFVEKTLIVLDDNCYQYQGTIYDAGNNSNVAGTPISAETVCYVNMVGLFKNYTLNTGNCETSTQQWDFANHYNGKFQFDAFDFENPNAVGKYFNFRLTLTPDVTLDNVGGHGLPAGYIGFKAEGAPGTAGDGTPDGRFSVLVKDCPTPEQCACPGGELPPDARIAAPGARISGTATSTIVDVSFALIKANSTLPLNLISFNGKATEQGNDLTWKTANEKNFSHFEIQKSTDAKKFEKIGEKASHESNNYEYLDLVPQPPKGDFASANYYRLKMIDLDGTFSFSKIIFIENKIEKAIVGNFYPNPSAGQVFVDINAIELGNWNITTFDLTGRINNAENKFLQKGLNKISIEKLNLGVNFVRFESGIISEIRKVIRE